MKAQKIEFVGRRENMSTFKVGPFYVHVNNKTELEKTLAKQKRAERFYVDETYSQLTPESAEHGDFSETGYTDFGGFYTLKELIKKIESGGFDEFNGHGGGADIYQSDFSTVDYSTGTEEQGCIHVSASKRNMERLVSVLKAKNLI